MGKPVKAKPYPWDHWFALAGRPGIVLIRGTDYRCSQATMVQLVRNRAAKVKATASIQDRGDSIWLEVTEYTISTESDELIDSLPKQSELPPIIRRHPSRKRGS